MPLASLFDILIDFLTEDGWAPEALPDERVVRVQVRGENGEWSAFAHVREEQQQVVVYSALPINAPHPRRAAVMEFVVRANYGLTIGNFDLDADDGELRFRTSLDVQGDRLSPALLRQLLWTNVGTSDKYLPGLRAVIEDEAAPGHAVQRVEDRSARDGHDHDFRAR